MNKFLTTGACRCNSRRTYQLPLLFLFLIISSANHAVAQGSASMRPGCKAYITFAAGRALNGSINGLSGNFILPSGWGGSFNYRQNYYHAKRLPADYGGSFCLFGDCTPTDNLSMYSLHLLRTFTLKETKLVRFALEGGPSLIRYSEAVFSPDTVKHSFLYFGSNYNLDYTQCMTVGLSLRAAISFPLSRGCGLEVGVPANINAYHSVLGIEGCLTAGLVRDRLKPRRYRAKSG